MWLVLTIISVVTGSLAATYIKKLRTNYNTITLSFSSTITAGLLIGILSINRFANFNLLSLLNPINIGFLLFLIILGGFLSHMLYSGAIKDINLSVMGTVENTRPFFTLMASFLIFHQGASFTTFLGIVVMFLGLSILSFKKGSKQTTGEFITYSTFKILIAVVIGAASSVFTKDILNSVDPMIFATINMLGIGIVAFASTLFIAPIKNSSAYKRSRFTKNTDTEHIDYSIFKIKDLYIRVILMVVSYVTIIYAFSMGDINKIAPIINTRSIILTAIGIFIYKETDIFKKSLACFITLMGAYLVVIG